MSAHAQLRAATASDHEAVDAAFGRFDLGDPAGYAAFLTAQGRALPAVEQALERAGTGIGGPPPLRPRRFLLAEDLAALGAPLPDPLAFAPPAGEAAAFGAAYVIEGSRLGGGMLARTVAPGLPRAYLSATHLPGEWRSFGRALDIAAEAGGDKWIEQSIIAAKRVFALYAAAANAASEMPL